MSKHSRLSASKSKQWLECPGSVQLSENAPMDETSAFALEGTAAHWVAELSLLDGKHPSSFIGKTYKDENGKVKVDDDMAYNVNVYIEEINSIRLKYPDAICSVEKPFDLGWLDKDIRGTNDCMIYIPSMKWLIVLDLKYGQGIVVEPEWNTQAMIYALGACYNLEVAKHQIETVTLGIVQPRAEHLDGPVRYWNLTRDELFHWAYTTLKPGADKTREVTPPLKTGDHCRFCKAAGICPEQVRSITNVTGVDPVTLALPDINSMTNDRLVKIMEMSNVISNWANKVAAAVKFKMENGEHVPGYKLVAGRATRKWINEQAAVQKLTPILGDAVYKTEILSVPQMEKAIKVRNLDANMLLTGLYDKKSNTVSVAPESDKRPALNASIYEDFKKVT